MPKQRPDITRLVRGYEALAPSSQRLSLKMLPFLKARRPRRGGKAVR